MRSADRRPRSQNGISPVPDRNGRHRDSQKRRRAVRENGLQYLRLCPSRVAWRGSYGPLFEPEQVKGYLIRGKPVVFLQFAGFALHIPEAKSRVVDMPQVRAVDQGTEFAPFRVVRFGFGFAFPRRDQSLLPGFYRVQFGPEFLHFVRVKVPFRRCKVPELLSYVDCAGFEFLKKPSF